jgi:hypothetical protein
MAKLEPPWLRYPEIPRYSIGWRMGDGENYYNAAYRLLSALSPDERAAYAGLYPEPEDWAGWYDLVADHPWL